MDPREQVQRQINETVNSIQTNSDVKPQIGIVLGSGFADFAGTIKPKDVLPYSSIAHFPISTVEGHPGNLILGKLEGKNVALLQGRFHFYEGYTMWGVTFPIRVLAILGIKTLIVTGASGSLSVDYNSGDLVLINDHLNLMPANPLIGPHVEEMGPRFIDMTEPYSKELRQTAKDAAQELGIDIKEGVYAAVSGPQYETPAEVKMLKSLGADVVGMSIVPEVIVAKQMGLNVLGINIVSNEHQTKEGITHSQVLENVGKSSAIFVKLLQAIVKKL